MYYFIKLNNSNKNIYEIQDINKLIIILKINNLEKSTHSLANNSDDS